MPELHAWFASPAWLWLLLAVPPLIRFVPARSRLTGGRAQRAAADGLRALALAALVMALAGPLEGSYSPHVDVVFALDVSHSIDRETAEDALAFVNRALAAKDPKASMGLVAFGADAGVEALLRTSAHRVGEISVEVERGHTNIERALEVALGTFPSGGHRRLVLLSDGRENLGRARAAAAAAASIGVEILAIALERGSERDEVRLQGLSAPGWVRVQEPFVVEMTLHSTRSADAHLVIMRNGTLIRETRVKLQPGANVYSLVEQAAASGLYEYEAIVNSEADAIPENNRFQTFVQVKGPPRVLHVFGEPGAERHLSAALRAQGLSVEEIPGTAVPGTRHKLTDFDLIVLNNVSGFDMSLAKMQLLEDYVRDGGGGLITIGGSNSYSAGGYYGTPVERALPVSMDVKSEVKVPSLAVTIVIDRSGSMDSGEKLAIAKDAALSAIEVLNPLDRVAVLAFDDQPVWSVPPTEVGNRRAIAEKLHAVVPGGGTDLLRALREAHRVTSSQSARVRHLIVLSDGLTRQDGDFEGLIGRIAKDAITVSTVSFGQDADQALMESIARWGNGRYYHTDDPRNIPRIFTSETLVISRDLNVESDTVPRLTYPGEMLAGFAADAFPLLKGYQRTFPKPAAQVLLSGAEKDPLLASWRYGLGKSVAFMSDLTGRWGQQWVQWPDFTRFVAQMARWTMRRDGSERLLPTFRWEGSVGEVSVDALDHDDRFVNGLDMRAVVTDPARGTRQVVLEQVAPGRYQGEFPVPRAGRYYVSLNGTAGSLRVGPETFGLAIPYSPEYIEVGADLERLRAIAGAAGGRVLPLGASALGAILAPSPRAQPEQHRIGWPLLLVALCALLLELGLRKCVVPASWSAAWQRARGSRRGGRRGSRDGATLAEEPGHEELVAQIAALREHHLRALRADEQHHLDDPAVRARLYRRGSKRRG